jgi:hypothetical protein
MFFFIISHVFSSTKSENKRVEQVWGGEEIVQLIYTHVSKCKSGKIKKKTNTLGNS